MKRVLLPALLALAVTVALWPLALATRTTATVEWPYIAVAIGVLVLLVVAAAGAWRGLRALLRRSRRDRNRRPRLLLSLGVFGVVLISAGFAWQTQYWPSSPPDYSCWAGYTTKRGGIKRVSATWTQPAVITDGSRPSVLSLWVGLNALRGDSLAQIGTDAFCGEGSGAASYNAWLEMYPAESVDVPVTIHPGDRLTASVSRLGADRFRLSLTDHSTGAQYTAVRTMNGAGTTGGSILAERLYTSGEALARFAPVRFSGCSFDGRPLARFTLVRTEIQNNDLDNETATSRLGREGTSFSVARLP